MSFSLLCDSSFSMHQAVAFSTWWMYFVSSSGQGPIPFLRTLFCKALCILMVLLVLLLKLMTRTKWLYPLAYAHFINKKWKAGVWFTWKHLVDGWWFPHTPPKTPKNWNPFHAKMNLESLVWVGQRWALWRDLKNIMKSSSLWMGRAGKIANPMELADMYADKTSVGISRQGQITWIRLAEFPQRVCNP